MRLQQGFSLVELMVTIAILVILITVAIPSFNSTLLRANASSLADSLITSLNYAKSEAISRNERVYLCARNAGGTGCLNNSANWNGGWLIRLSSNNNTIRDVRIATNAEVDLRDGNGAQSDKQLVYRSSGEVLLIDGVNTTTPNGLFFLAQIDRCNDPQINIRRQINIALSGLTTVNTGIACQ
jgi:type IV fimbrial biogenesis protein FimT